MTSFSRSRLLVRMLMLVFLTSLLGTPVPSLYSAAPALQAAQNLTLDPWGRVIDVTFTQDMALTAPWDRFRFGIDIVQPLARDSGAFLGDLNGDSAKDLLLADFEGRRLFFPGIAGKPHQFGAGTYLRHKTVNPDDDPFYDHQSGYWVAGDIGDLDGDGKQDLVIGAKLFNNIGAASEPILQQEYLFTGDGVWDPAASLGDFNNDGKLDVVVSFNYGGGSWLFYNQSTPGAFSFVRVKLNTWTAINAPHNRLMAGDLNGDRLLDLAGAAGIYFNSGSLQLPSFDFTRPSPWNITGGISWAPTSDQGTNVFLEDGNGDGLLDAYVSNLGSTVWQTLFYRNIGTAIAHQMQYVGPVAVASTPVNIGYRSTPTPNFSPLRAFVAAADIDQNNLSDILLSTSGGDSFGEPTILWNFGDTAGSNSASFSYQDLYTFPTLNHADLHCSTGPFSGGDALCTPPNLFSAWLDLTSDGRADALSTNQFMDEFTISRRTRTGSWPFTLDSAEPLTTAPSGNQAIGWGIAIVDVNLDQRLDLITGSLDGRLLYYQNTTTTIPVTSFADPVPLSDANGMAIDVGDQSWPTAIDLNGDGCLDLLVADEGGTISRVSCVSPGSIQGYAIAGLLATPEQNPVNVTNIFGGGAIAPSLTTMDVDNDGLKDIVMGTAAAEVWWLRNIGTTTSASFSLRPLTVSRTAAAYMEQLDARHIRLYFALPTTVDQTVLSYQNLPTTSTPLSGETIITAPQSALTIDDVSILEGNSGSTQAVFTVHLSPASNQSVSVTYQTNDGSATAPGDYIAIPPTILTFAPGQTTQIISVQVNGDILSEADEIFSIALSNPTNATIARPQATGTIINDDSNSSPLITIENVSIVEGNTGITVAAFPIRLSSPSSQPVTVHYSTGEVAVTLEGVATPGGDYRISTSVVVFSPGETLKTIPIDVYGDTLPEPDETFTVMLHSAMNATIGIGDGQGVIINDDQAQLPLPSITSFTPTSGPVGTQVLISGQNLSGATAVTFNATSASFTVISPTSISATVPQGAITGLIRVTTSGGSTSSASPFTVTTSNGHQDLPYKIFLPAVVKDDGSTTIVREDFENATTFPGSWQVSDEYPGTGEFYWSRRNCRSSTPGGHAAWAVGGGASGTGLPCGSQYPNDAESWMVYGPFNLTDAADAEFRLKLWLKSEIGYDGVCMLASSNNQDFSGTCASGDTGGWVDRSLNLTNVYELGNLTGRQQVWVAIVFSSDDSINRPEGAYVDDIVLRKWRSSRPHSTGQELIEQLTSTTLVERTAQRVRER